MSKFEQLAEPVLLTLSDGAEQRGRALSDIHAERVRQISDKGYSTAHDDEYGNGELARAAASYLLRHAASTYPNLLPTNFLLPAADSAWPWNLNRRRRAIDRHSLVISGALILAELERFDRMIARDAAAHLAGSEVAR